MTRNSTWKISMVIATSAIITATTAFATPIPTVTKAVLTDDAKAIIEVKSSGSANTLYMYQVAERGREKDCADSSAAKEIKGCRVAAKERNRTSYISGPIQNGKGVEFRYRVAAFDPSGGNPKNSGWSSWQTLYVVTGITPQQGVTKGKKTTFTHAAKGTAPSTLKFTLSDANCDASNSFACTPQAAGNKQWMVVDKPGGVALAKGQIVVQEPAGNTKPNLSHPGYNKPLNPFTVAGYGGQCTAFAWGRGYEVFGKKMDSTRSAKYWWSGTGYKKGATPKAKSIAVWGGDSSNPHGHVGFVEQVNANGDIVINEANIKTYKGTNYGGGYDGAPITLSSQKILNRGKAIGKLLGYIYIGD